MQHKKYFSLPIINCLLACCILISCNKMSVEVKNPIFRDVNVVNEEYENYYNNTTRRSPTGNLSYLNEAYKPNPFQVAAQNVVYPQQVPDNFGSPDLIHKCIGKACQRQNQERDSEVKVTKEIAKKDKQKEVKKEVKKEAKKEEKTEKAKKVVPVVSSNNPFAAQLAGKKAKSGIFSSSASAKKESQVVPSQPKTALKQEAPKQIVPPATGKQATKSVENPFTKQLEKCKELLNKDLPKSQEKSTVANDEKKQRLKELWDKSSPFKKQIKRKLKEGQ